MGYAHFINFNPNLIVYGLSTAQENQILYNAFLADLIEANISRS
jgi:hypothetical protein